MRPEFTPDGIEIQTFQQIRDELAQAYRDIYGEDINLDPDSPDGQRVGIESQARLDLQSFAAYMYTQIDPDTALGQALNVVIKFAGINRRPATRSQVDVTVTTDRPVTLPDDYTVEDALGQQWVTLDEVELTTADDHDVTLFAENFGSVDANADTVTEPVTIVIGVQSVTNPAGATVGTDEETDEELRVRRNRSLQTPATSTVGGMFTALGDLTGVTDLAVYENDQDTEDTERNIDPHTIWCVVEGGGIEEIIETIAKNKTGGTGLKGDVTGTYIETLQKPNGDTYEIIHEMRFDRPTEVDLHVRLTATRKDPDVPVDVDGIEQQLAEREFSINDNVQAGALYRTVYQASDTFIATDLEVSDDGSTWTDGRLESGPDEKFVITEANVDVTEVIP